VHGRALKRTFALKLGYDGSGYRGWQRQPGKLTVQAAMEEALSRLLEKRPVLQGASRTDAGVHAEGQVASFATGRAFHPEKLVLPAGLRLLDAAEAAASFHARASSSGKEYRYLFSWGNSDPAFGYALGREARPDWARARSALEGLAGLDSLSGLASPFKPHRPAPPLESWSLQEGAGTRDDMEKSPDLATLLVSGKAFRKHQLRNLAGHLALIALGLAEPHTLAELAGRRRPWMGATAPAHGLTLLSVRYPREVDPFLRGRVGQNAAASSTR